MGVALYSGPPDGLLTSVPLDGLTALFHRPSAATHVVTEPLPEILAALADRPLDLAALMLRLDVPDDADNRAALSARLDELIESGLVAQT